MLIVQPMPLVFTDPGSNLPRPHPENSGRPSVEALFRSVAEVYDPRALAVVMPGIGQDGLRGCEFMRQAGSQIIVQDEATSVV